MNYTTEQLELKAHIQSKNAQSQAEMDANPNIWIGMIVDDLDHWAEYGIYSPAQYDRYMDEVTLYETVSIATSKSYARSVVANTNGMTDEEFKKELDYWGQQADNEIKREQEEEAMALKDFEKRVLDTINTGAGDRKTAIKWILQGEGLEKERDPGYVCYCLGLPYSMEKEFKEVA